ncbi:MAG: rRNA maturation RNase YbeY [Xanthobacteraceae bacterium]
MARSGRRKRHRGLDVEIIVKSPLWREQARAELWVHNALAVAAEHVEAPRGEVAVVLTDDSAVRALNRKWRRIDAPTNVLSFPAKPGGAGPLFGDIVIAYETTWREAEEGRKPFDHHLAHLAVHGFLHLLGHDHGSDAEAEAMERLESVILAELEVPDPYVRSECES